MKFEQLTRFARGFVYAYNGIRAAIREERNFRFHLCAALYAFVAAYWAQLPAVETALIALCVAVVLALIFSSLFSWTPGLKTVSPGLSIVICTVAAAAICAALFPVKEEREAA